MVVYDACSVSISRHVVVGSAEFGSDQVRSHPHSQPARQHTQFIKIRLKKKPHTSFTREAFVGGSGLVKLPLFLKKLMTSTVDFH
jgi:hypothetical protein